MAHEIFHAVELRAKDTIFTQTYRLQLWKLGPLKNESGVACLAEIAGMEFARTLLALDFCPYLYDVFFVSLYDAPGRQRPVPQYLPPVQPAFD